MDLEIREFNFLKSRYPADTTKSLYFRSLGLKTTFLAEPVKIVLKIKNFIKTSKLRIFKFDYMVCECQLPVLVGWQRQHV